MTLTTNCDVWPPVSFFHRQADSHIQEASGEARDGRRELFFLSKELKTRLVKNLATFDADHVSESQAIAFQHAPGVVTKQAPVHDPFKADSAITAYFMTDRYIP